MISRTSETSHVRQARLSSVWLVAIVALSVRIIFLFLMHDTFLWNGIWSDAATYDAWARQIVSSGDWIGKEPFFMSPLYPYFLAGTYSVFGESYLAVRIVQALLGSAVAVLVYLMGEQLFNRKAALIAGLLSAVYGPFILSGGLLLVETLKVFFLVLTLYLLLVLRGRGHWWWLIPGLALGFAVLSRPTDLMIMVVVGVWLIFLPGKEWKWKTQKALTFALGVVLVVAPVTIRNFIVSGEMIMVTSNGGLNLYIGNNPDAVGIYYNVERIDLINDPDGRLSLESQTGRSVRHAEASSLWASRAIDFAAGQPFAFLALLGKKLVLFFHYKEISQLGYNMAFVSTYAVPLLKFFPSFLIAGSLGLLGCILAWRKWRSLFLLYGFLVAEILGVVLFFVTDRFRLSAMPFMIIFAGYGAAELISWIAQKDWRRIGQAGAILAAACLVTTFLNFNIPDDYSMEWEQVGLMHYAAKDHRAALQAFQESRKFKDSFHLQNNIGNVYAALGQLDVALDHFRKGEELNPAQPMSAFGQGTVYAGRQKWVSALEALDRSIRINPRFAPAHLNRGLVLFHLQQFEDALSELRTYAQLETDKTKLATVYRDIRNLENLVQQESGKAK